MPLRTVAMRRPRVPAARFADDDDSRNLRLQQQGAHPAAWRAASTRSKEDLEHVQMGRSRASYTWLCGCLEVPVCSRREASYVLWVNGNSLPTESAGSTLCVAFLACAAAPMRALKCAHFAQSVAYGALKSPVGAPTQAAAGRRSSAALASRSRSQKAPSYVKQNQAAQRAWTRAVGRQAVDTRGDAALRATDREWIADSIGQL